MDVWQVIIVGILQGATEFIPVSSSGHLVIVPYLLKIPELSVEMIVFLHFGTLLAVLGFYRKDVSRLIIASWELLTDLFLRRGILKNYRKDVDKRLACLILFSTIVTGIIGLGGKDFFEARFEDVGGVGFFLLVTGVVLWIVKNSDGKKEILEMGIWSALIIGLAQALAIIPGISRSGTTIVAGLLFCGLRKSFAVRYAFLLSIPAILAATLFKIKDVGNAEDISVILIGTTIAAISGYLAIKWFVMIIQRISLSWFAYWCWILALGVLSLYYIIGYNTL